MNWNNSANNSLSITLARNNGYNILAQVIVIVLAIWAIPILVHGLGGERFGVLAILWAFVGYFSLLDLGISRANTKFLAEAIALGDNTISSKIVWTSLTLSAGFGLISMFAIIAMTPFLVSDVFKIAPEFYKEVTWSFSIAAVSIPFMLILGTIKGIQMAFQRFDMVNGFQGVMGVVQWVGSVILVMYGLGLKEIILLTLVLRIVLSAWAFSLLPKLIPSIYHSIRLWDKQIVRKLLSFGGWVSVSQIVGPVIVYLDRVLIGAFLSMTAVAYYSVPQEGLMRVLFIPASLSATLFPVFSGQAVLPDDRSRMTGLYFRSIKYLILIMLPLTMGAIVYAHDILRLWVGLEYSKESTLVFQILAGTLVFNSIAQVSTTVLHAFNRPDLTAKIHIAELLLMVLMNIILIPLIGIVGAAITFSLRVFIDMILLFFVARRYASTPYFGKHHRYSRRILGFDVILLVVFSVAVYSIEMVMIKFILTGVFAIIYVVWVWFYYLDHTDKHFLNQLKTRIVG
jgi:O-antigen/teichoic acid export membrane protein